MAAKSVLQLPTGPHWAKEPKWDGYRGLVFSGANGVRLQSRQLRDLTPAFPDVAGAVEQLGDVVLDGEVVIWRSGHLDFGALQERLRAGRPRVQKLVADAPATYVVFDLLSRNGKDLLTRPYWKRRRKLEDLVLPPGIILTPATDDSDVASSWMDLARRGNGLEGVVAKRRDQSYRPGAPAWQKLRTRITSEAVVGGITGSLNAPRELILGRYDATGGLRIAGRTGLLRSAAASYLAPLLEAQDHGWPDRLPEHRWGTPPTSYTRVRPRVVVEVSADLAVDGLRWRHPVRFVRLRAELHPVDLLPPVG